MQRAAKLFPISMRSTSSRSKRSFSPNRPRSKNLNLLVLKLKRMHFGQRSEKLNADIAQLELRLEDLEDSQAAAIPLPAQLATVAVIRSERMPARRPWPRYCCGRRKRSRRSSSPVPIAVARYAGWVKDVSEVLEYVSARFEVMRTVRPKLSCACCSRILQEPAPHRPIDKGLAGPRLLAHVLVAKYSGHPPLYRQSEIYAREGVEIEQSTMADWVGGASRTLGPLVEALKSYVLSAEKLHMATMCRFRCWNREQAKRKQDGSGLMLATTGRREAKCHRQSGSPTRRIEKANTR